MPPLEISCSGSAKLSRRKLRVAEGYGPWSIMNVCSPTEQTS
jgi:hypothetical protein